MLDRPDLRARFDDDGYCFPVRALGEADAVDYRRRFEDSDRQYETVPVILEAGEFDDAAVAAHARAMSIRRAVFAHAGAAPRQGGQT